MTHTASTTLRRGSVGYVGEDDDRSSAALVLHAILPHREGRGQEMDVSVKVPCVA